MYCEIVWPLCVANVIHFRYKSLINFVTKVSDSANEIDIEIDIVVEEKKKKKRNVDMVSFQTKSNREREPTFFSFLIPLCFS